MASNKSSKVLQTMETTIKEELEKFNAQRTGNSVLYLEELQKTIDKKTKLDGQKMENENVKDELDLLEEGAEVYKLVGPVLVKQDLEEAKQTVNKRLDYISKEVERCESKIKDLEKKQDNQAGKLAKLQQEYQQQAGKVSATHR